MLQLQSSIEPFSYKVNGKKSTENKQTKKKRCYKLNWTHFNGTCAARTRFYLAKAICVASFGIFGRIEIPIAAAN